MWQEIVVQGFGRAGARAVQDASWIRLVAPPETLVESMRGHALQAGETEAIAVALSIEPRICIILDDRRARLVATNAQLTVTGTAGVLALAKRLGLIATFGTLITELRLAGLYISDSAVNQLRELVGEGGFAGGTSPPASTAVIRNSMFETA